MLTATFIHAPGVGYATEQKIWEQGILSWNEYIKLHETISIPENKKPFILSTVQNSIEALNANNHLYFANQLPSKEHWRAFSHFGKKGSIAYLDIETTGCGYYDDITVIGYYNGYDMKSYVKGINMNEFPYNISEAAMLVTFFGSGFDLPFLRRRFPSLKLNQLHIDLCFLMKRIGLTGGLKHIESILNIPRTPETDGLNGMDAVRLWREFQNGNDDALNLLLHYNKEDVINMELLLNFGIKKMQEILFEKYNI